MQLHRSVDAWPWLARMPISSLVAHPSRCRGLPAHAAQGRMSASLPPPRRLSHAPLPARGTQRPSDRLRARDVLPGLLLGAHARHVRRRRRAPGLDGCARLIMLVEKGAPHGERIVVPVGAALGLLAAVALVRAACDTRIVARARASQHRRPGAHQSRPNARGWASRRPAKTRSTPFSMPRNDCSSASATRTSRRANSPKRPGSITASSTTTSARCRSCCSKCSSALPNG